MKYINISFLGLIAFLWLISMTNVSAQCTTFAEGPYIDYNTAFGGAPCDDGAGCPVNSIEDFSVWASESYLMDNIQAGGSYTFSHCTGTGAGSWVPDYTIIAPSGAIDAFGAGDGDGCSITWVATESGTYQIGINEAAQCGGGPNVGTNNGFGSITCGANTSCDPCASFVAGLSFADMVITANPMGGTEPYIFQWSTGESGVTSITIPEIDQTYSVTITDSGECAVVDSIFATDICTQIANGPFGDFNTQFGGAPCDDGTGCQSFSTQDIGFEVFAAEAYLINYLQSGNNYIWSQCEGPGAMSWVPEFTIVAPSGAVDAFGAGDGDGCSISWTASESGTYTIYINEAGQCGGGLNTGTGNGYGVLSCVDGAACEPCVAPLLNLSGSPLLFLCEDGTFDLNGSDGNVPEFGLGGYIISELNGIADPIYFTPAELVGTYDATLNGTLTAPLAGSYVIKSFSSLGGTTGSICSISEDSILLIISNVNEVTRDMVLVDNEAGTATITFNGNSVNIPSGWTLDWEGVPAETGVTATYEVSGDYTLTVTDDIGCSTTRDFTMDISVGIEALEGLQNFRISPNPTSGQFEVALGLNEVADIDIYLFDVVGQKVKIIANETSLGNIFSVDGASLPQGLYFLQVKVGDVSFSERILITK